RWIAAIIAGAFLITAATHRIEAETLWNPVTPLLEAMMYGRYGLDGLLTARTESLKTVIQLVDGHEVSVWRGIPLVSDWIVATLLWTGLGIAGLFAALMRHRERR